MFNASIYKERRRRLKEKFSEGVLFFPGNHEIPMNYTGNTYDFRQDSSFLYYFGIDRPGLAGVIDIDKDEEIIYGDERGIEDIIWMGEQKSLKDMCNDVGILISKPFERLTTDMRKLSGKSVKIHYLPQYHELNKREIAYLLELKYQEVDSNVSLELISRVAGQRSLKSLEEIDEMEYALNNITYEMHVTAMKMAVEGAYEYQISGAVKGIVMQHDCMIAYPVICSVHGEILHNHNYNNKLEKGQWLLIDAGAESPLHYATDITRTFPVDGVFTDMQKDLYTIVLDAQLDAIRSVQPGVSYRIVHREASLVIARGLKQLGLMKGDVEDAVTEGAHALFFPHGLGHLMGLDVHDMENLGEDNVGYDEKNRRGRQFGLASLRFGKVLQPGHVVTAEPGIYFIPALIEQWRADKKFTDFIDYNVVDKYMKAGGVRIEDNILVTDKGNRVLGKPIPKTIMEIEDQSAGNL